MSESQPLLQHEHHDDTPVYPIIQMIRADVSYYIDTPLSYEALTAPDLTYTLIHPLFEKYSTLQRNGNRSIIFCFLINRVHFVRDYNIATAPVSRSRGELCEILATRILRDYGSNIFNLVLALTTSWHVFSGADEAMMAAVREEREDIEETVGNAIEMAILGKAKRFIKSSSCQKVINSIWTGKCVYQAESSHSILSDTYKRTPIHFYDPHKAPLLDHYRLKVPSIRSVLEYSNFLMLFVFFVIAIEMNEISRINIYEVGFMIYALGFSLEKVAAMQEHGIQVYFKGTWNGFDLALITTYGIYAFLRLYGVYHHSEWARTMGIDFLALMACLLFPRLAFVTLRNNLMVLSLRAMMMQFVVLMLIAAFCFCGFLYALWTLSRNGAGYSAGTIAWWMADLWFGLDASGFDRSTQFHPVFGPVLMVTYACLSNTLLLTVLVSILSNTFAKINEDAAAEAMFRKAVSTIEGVKADSLFSYQPPINVVALCVMLPMRYILSPRWFHKVNVFMIRLTSFPILLVIALYERQSKKSGTTSFYETIAVAAEKVFDTLPRRLKRLTFFEGLAGAEADIDAIFEIEDELDNSALDTGDDSINGNGFELARQKRRMSATSPTRPPPVPLPTPPRRPSASSSRSQHQPQHQTGSPSNPHPIPRARVNSVMNRVGHLLEGGAQSFTSPLAQIFQPLMVDEDTIHMTVPEDEPFDPSAQGSTPPSHGQGHNMSTGMSTGMVSYGPASRRRLSSIQSQHRRGTSAGEGSFLHPFPTGASQQHSLHQSHTQGNLRRTGPATEGVLSESPTSAGSGPMRPTAEKVREEEEDVGGTPQFSARLAKMERRQERIEGLLEKLVEGMNKGK